MKRIATIAAALLLLAMSGADAQQLQTVHVSAAPLDTLARQRHHYVKADSPLSARPPIITVESSIAIAGIKTIAVMSWVDEHVAATRSR
jgi:hypothetical protein